MKFAIVEHPGTADERQVASGFISRYAALKAMSELGQDPVKHEVIRDYAS
ncbi:hypothetical protein HUG10_21095 (plasmid) [Halorarum halophilum]|uniref:Uncharacterized protein n=1 Tax=Halorarum halophilum TaxID=2743090 RepID=A0A7D5GEV1_9EURY|nr:hypothetical protein [Halobaculum halophilum]QLG30085.1 hypothetical protein HUG10_21095 [Halobaculum halophilum]